MRIALDGRPLENGNRYFGIGAYSRHLIKALLMADCLHQWVVLDRQAFDGSARDGASDVHHLFDSTSPFPATGRTVATVYDVIPLVFPSVYQRWHHPRATWHLRRYYRFLSTLRHLVAISEQTRRDLVRYLGIPEQRITVIYPGIAPVFRPLEDAERGRRVAARYGIRQPFLLYVGSGDWRKNLAGLLAAFAQFRAGGFNEFSLTVVGYQTARQRRRLLQQAAALGCRGALRLTGFVPLEDLAALYGAAAVLIYPSLYEGFGFPPLEAMACGTPVVTSRNSSLQEVVGAHAVLVDPRQTSEIVEGIRRVVQDRGVREALVQQGLACARRYTWERTAQATLKLYGRL